MRLPPLLLLALLAAACGSDTTDADDESETLTAADLGRTEEARAYIAGDGGIWSEDLSIDELAEWTEALYVAGAERVMFADVGDFEGTDLSAWFVVKLPGDKAKRSAVFAAFNAVMKKYYAEETPDRGQAYLDLALD